MTIMIYYYYYSIESFYGRVYKLSKPHFFYL